ncbi:prealbumin-like fold domain-containing protein [Microbacterium paraoxydans]|uniref:SpaA-like prealbumin fold domain-containing protein n=1 Tax=Microbacterium paraoxydans TaxID=199592 RepID=A0A1H1LTV6_9MICO|nr:hypothetical protein [Microbacterium paraoxydans]SDR77956.1 hypothetical protein SAMN04489809_0283 [Microbacterium paraoxydans]
MGFDARERLLAAGLGLVLATGTLLAPIGATAVVLPPAKDLPLLVTYVARVCDQYTDVMANKARNNLMESLRDLGADTTYPANGIITVADEEAGSPNCSPLTDWRLTMGRSHQGKSAATLNLSTVTQPFASTIVTKPSVPELDAQGADTGRIIEGAVTVELDSTQAQIVRSGQTLWVQGGTPSEPLNGRQETHGYAALRCAQDAVNGDNVEFLSFPKNQTHVFCYYYAVSPPPESGTIVVRKQLAPSSLGQGTFRFDGNLSYADTNRDGVNDFTLSPSASSPASQTFIRGAVGTGEPAWEVTEAPTDGWQPTGPPVCSSAGGTPVTITEMTAQIRLLAGDTVTCTFTNERVRTGPGTLSKLTVGAGGTFPFAIDVPAPGADRQTTVTTAGDGDQALVAESLGSTPGTYTVTETLPAPTGAGSWEAQGAQCNGTEVPLTADGQQRTGTVEIGEGETFDCVVTNRYTPGGSITIRKATTPVAGSAGFVVTPREGARITPGTSAVYQAVATTTTVGEFVEAEWEGPAADALTVEPSAHYGIVELLPAPSAEGSWSLASADCGANAATVDTESASVDVILTPENPDAICDFTNEFQPAGHLLVVKNGSDDVALRAGDARLEVQCTPDTSYSFALPVGAGTADAGNATVLEAHECRVIETETGAAPDTTVATTASITIDGGAPVALEPFDAPFPVRPGVDTVVTIDNRYTADPAPPPTPSPSPSISPTGGSGAEDLARTGVDRGFLAIIVALGAATVALGLVLLLYRRRTSTRR